MHESHPLDPLVRRWSRHVALSSEDRKALTELPFTRRSYSKDAYIVRDGERATTCSLLLKGFAFRQKVVRNGSRQIISIHIPTEFVDLQNQLLAVADHNVQSLDRSEVAEVQRSDLRDLAAARPALATAMWMDTLIDASVFREWVVNVGRRHARARIAHLLCELAARLQGIGMAKADTLDFPLTQEQVADATGLTAVHTNRVLQALRKDGLIRLTGRTLTILDWDGLRAVGDFDDTYLHSAA